MRISDCSSDVCSSDLAERFGVEDHRQRQTVLDRAAGIERLYLDVHADVFGRDAIEAHDGGVADGVENAVMDHGQELAIRSDRGRSEEHTSELQSLMRISYAVFCLKKKTTKNSDIVTHINDI